MVAINTLNSTEGLEMQNSGTCTNLTLAEVLRQHLVSTLISFLPNKENLSLEDIESLGVFGAAARQNFYQLRAQKRGPKFKKTKKVVERKKRTISPWNVSVKIKDDYLYPKKEFIDWIFNNTKFKIGEYK